MKRLVICLGVLGTAAAGWPELRPDTYRQQVEFKYPEPLVSQTTVQNGWKHKDTRLSDKDLGRDFFTITGDEQHKPIPVWSDQDTLDISFPVGTSCATEYRFRLNPGTCYLGGAAAPQDEAPSNTLTIGSISLDLDARNAYRSGVLADLTAKEFDLLELLVTNPNKVYSREALLSYVWGNKAMDSGDVRTVDVHVRRLREKIEPSPSDPKYVHTKWGVGYYFRA